MQSEVARELIEKHQVGYTGINTLLLIKEGECYVRTNAALEIAKDLTGFWHLFTIAKVIPAPIRDYGYRLFARYRYKLFGRQGTCMVPTEELRQRFLGG